MMTVQSPERKSKCCQFLSQKWRKKNTFLLYFTPEIWISESVNYESMGQYIVLNQLLTSLTFHTTFKNTTTLLRLGKRKEDNEPSRLTHFTSTQAKQENTIIKIEAVQPWRLSCLLGGLQLFVHVGMVAFQYVTYCCLRNQVMLSSHSLQLEVGSCYVFKQPNKLSTDVKFKCVKPRR